MTFITSINRRILQRVIPPIFYDFYRHAFRKKKSIIDNSASSNLNQNISLKDIHKGKRCFIVATGPSVSKVDLRKLKDEECICISRSYLHPYYPLLKPRYHIINPVSKAHPKILPLAVDWFREIENKVSSHTSLLFAKEDYELIENNKLFLKYEKYYGDYQLPIDSITEGIDFCKPVIKGQSTSILAIAWAIYMGFSEIYMLGIDHDWIVHNLKKEYENKHFYNEADCVMESKAIKTHKNESLETLFLSLAQLWKDYRLMQDYAIKKGVTILNVTEGSLLDNLPVEKLESVLP